MKVQLKRNDKCYVFFTEWAYIAKEIRREKPYVIKLSHNSFRLTVYRSKSKPPIINLKVLSCLSAIMYCVSMAAVGMFAVMFWAPGRLLHLIGHVLIAIGQLMMGHPSTARIVLSDSLSVYVKGMDILR